MITTHVVRTGEHLATIAHARGLDADEVWNHPKNEGLREKRSDKNILREGDVLFLPMPEDEPLSIQVGQKNRFRAHVPKLKTTLRFADAKGPFANEPYVVEVLDERLEGITDGEGMAEVSAPVGAKVAKIVFEGRRASFSILVGEMDPVTETSGLQLRLRLLGHMSSDATGEMDEETTKAIQAFQKAQQLDSNGAADEATQAALIKAYGC